MRPFKPGDKVWIDNQGPVPFPAGTYAGVLIRPSWVGSSWWDVALEDESPLAYEDACFMANEQIMRHRDDPAPQQEPEQRRELLGSWDKCHWRPPVEEFV